MTKLCLVVDKNAVSRYPILKKSKYILSSFYYCKTDLGFTPDLWLVDSGAFTLFSKKRINLDEYVNNYIRYINDYNIKHFFELDIDCIVGYDEVLKIRNKIEKGTKKQCIPVWHHSRGKEEFIKMCKNYKYCSIGGLASKEELSKHKDKYRLLNMLAKKYNSKLHGLGLTDTRLEHYGFYSVDSTTWTNGARMGLGYKFDGKKIIKIVNKGKRMINSKDVDEYNIEEWLKYQNYLDKLGDGRT